MPTMPEDRLFTVIHFTDPIHRHFHVNVFVGPHVPIF